MIRSGFSKNFNFQFLRFLFVGGVNTLFGYGVFSFFIFISIHYSVAALLSTILGVIFNFFSTGKIVFNSVNKKAFPKFVLAYVVTYFLNIAGLKILQDLNFNSYEAGAMMIAPLSVFSYFILKIFVYHKIQ